MLGLDLHDGILTKRGALVSDPRTKLKKGGGDREGLWPKDFV